jgi:hypothetical protein
VAKNTAKDAKMAADLKARGIYHGRRFGHTLAPPVPPIGEAGSAAYRRLMRKKGDEAWQRAA